MIKKAELAIIGGSGFYGLVSELAEVKVETPFGPPSDKIGLGKIGRHRVAFLPRHGQEHSIPPQVINYRANIWALKFLGVERIITIHAVGSLQTHIKPGDFVVLDQFIDRTTGRKDTFYDGPIATHISTAFPYCPQLGKVAVKELKSLGLPFHEKGTVVVIQGPRFSTAAESIWYTKMGWEVINMTEYPEVVLAKEKEMCYCAIALVTDYDAGLVAKENLEPVSAKEVIGNFSKNIEKAKKLVLAMIENWPAKTSCQCQSSLKGARFS